MSKISKTQRWLDLIAHLAGRRYPVPIAELMELPAYAGMKRETATRIFERDLKELREARIPIVTRRESAGGNEESDGYTLASGDFYLPYLEIVGRGRAPRVVPGVTRPGTVQVTEAEATDALEALGRAACIPGSPLADDARRAYAKLALDFDPGTFPGAPVVYAEPPGGAEPQATLRTLTDAVTGRCRVRFRYHGIARGAATDRRVAPFGLVRTGGSWYLVGYDEDRQAMREFRVRRVEAVSMEDRGEPFEIPSDFRLDAWLGRDAWELGEEAPLETHVRFAFPLSLWAERNGKGTMVESGPDGAGVRSFRVRQTDSFLRWVLSFAGEAEILSPPGLRTAAAELARAVAERYTATLPHG